MSIQRKKAIWSYIVAGALGLGASGVAHGLFIHFSVERTLPKVRAGWSLVHVVTVTRDLPEGTFLTADMLEQTLVPEQFVSGSVLRPDTMEFLLDQKISSPLHRGDFLRWGDFETTRGLASAGVNKHGRAVRVPIEGPCDIGTWIRPTDHVDLVFVGPDPEGGLETTARILVQNVSVVAMGRLTADTNPHLLQEGERDCEAVLVQMLPEEAVRVALAMSIGKVVPLLRNPEDGEFNPDLPRITSVGLNDEDGLARYERRRRETIQTIRGDHR